MNIKRIMALLLALVMVLSLVVMGFQVLATEETQTPDVDVDTGTDDDFVLGFDQLVDAVGTENNPIEITASGDFAVDVKANSETYYAISSMLNGQILTVIGVDGMTVTLNDTALTADEDGIFTAELVEGYVQHKLVIANTTEADVETTGNINYALGTSNNPIVINSMDDTLWYTVPAGSTLYVQISSMLNELQLTVSAMDITLNNQAVTAGTTTILTGTPWNYVVLENTTEADIEAYLNIEYQPGTEGNPAWLYDQENTVEVTGTTYYQGYFSGMTMTVTGTDFSVIYNGETLTAADGVVTTDVSSSNPRMPVVFAITGEGTYQVNFAYPEGSVYNPAALVIGENNAVCAAAGQGVYYTWTATEDGTLTITMPDGDWTYVVNNMTTYVYGDTQCSDSDPVQQSYSVEVAAGDEIQIMVNTYDPDDMWNAPAGTITFTAAFEAAIVKFSLAGANMTLGNELAMNFYMNKTDYVDGFYAMITKTDYQGNKISTRQEIEAAVGRPTLMVATFDGIAAKEMGDTLEVVIYNSDGVAVSEVWTDSIKGYCSRALKGTTDTKILAMVVEMLNYGAAAQTQFSYDVENLVNSDLTEEQKAYGIASVEMQNDQIKGTAFAGANLTLESKIELNFYFDPTVVTEEAFGYVVITFTDHYGDEQEYRVEEYKTGLSRMMVVVDQIALADAFSLVNVKVYNAEGTVIAEGSDSVESYAYRATQNSDSPLYTAIMKFAQSAYNYFH